MKGHGGWDDDDLGDALRRYESYLRARSLAPITVESYMRYGRLFLEWRIGDYTPRGMRPPMGRRVAAGKRDLAGLEAELRHYRTFLADAGLKPGAVATYVRDATRFVRWLGNEGRPRSARVVAPPRATKMPSARSAVALRAPDLNAIVAARLRYKQIEPRDLFYRAAIDLVGRARLGSEPPLTLGEAVAVLLFSWNQAFYRYHRPSNDHVDHVEALIAQHRPALDRWRATRLAPEAIGDHRSIEATFGDFEDLLGPVGTAKGLHLLAPTFFPIWDRTIAAAYRCSLGTRGTNAPRYVRFMQVTAAQCAELERADGAPIDVVKALDEWNYVTFTRKGV